MFGKKRARIGDICEIKTPAGLACLQYAHDGGNVGKLAQVLPGLSWSYDAWANQTGQVVQDGGGMCANFGAAADVSNRLVAPPSGPAYQYDAAGNLTNDGRHSYTYDAENRLAQVDGGATATYAYDAEGRRVGKTTAGGSIDYVYDLAGNVVAETNANGWQIGYVYFGDGLVAQYRNSTTYFVHRDHLGSTREVTTLAAQMQETIDYLPYGETLTSTGFSTHKFTGKERDSESGLDNFGARYMGSSLGRFMTPDWSAAPMGVPYANFGDPQSLNLYVYVRDNPVSGADADGHQNENGAQGTRCALETGENCSQQEREQLRVAQAGQPTQVKNQNAGTPAPTNPDGTPKPPPNPPPPGASGKPNEWVRVPGTEGRPDKWVPRDPVPSPQGGQPQGSWDEKGGHWDMDDGRGSRNRYLPDGTKVDHINRPIPAVGLWDRIKSIPPQPVVAAGTAAVIIYIIVSEGSRLYLPRNVVPIP